MQSNARPLDAELFPRLSKFMAEMQANNDDSQPNSPTHMYEDDFHHHPHPHDDLQHNHTPTAYFNGNGGVPTNLNQPSANNHHYYPITNGETKSLQIIYNGNGIGGGGATAVGGDKLSSSQSSALTNQPEIVERIARDWGADSIDDVNAATAMLALKHGPKVFCESYQNGYYTLFF